MFNDENDEIEFLDEALPKDLIEDEEDLEVIKELVNEEVEEDPKPKEEEDDKESYSKRVQKRLDKLVYERNVERELRAKEAEDFKTEQAAFRAEIEELKKHRQQEVETQSKQEHDEKLKELYQRRKDAFEIGDYDDVNSIDDELMEIKLQGRKQKPEPVAAQTQAEPARRPVREPEPAANMSQAQQAWEQSNPWIYDANQKSRLDKTNKIFQELLDNGYYADDPDTFAQLDKKLRRETPPAAGAPDRGQVVGTNQKTSFTPEDKKKMVAWGLDPDNAAHRKEWIKNRR